MGISQPCLFRLSGTKEHLFTETTRCCMADVLERLRRASDGLRGREALGATGQAYVEMITTDPRRLRGQMQANAASVDP